MKKFLMGLLVIFAALTSAFTTLPEMKANDSKQAPMYWFIGSSYTGNFNSRAVEVPLSSCPDIGTKHCEDGYDANDFNVTGDPYSGLSTGATLNDFIRKN